MSAKNDQLQAISEMAARAAYRLVGQIHEGTPAVDGGLEGTAIVRGVVGGVLMYAMRFATSEGAPVADILKRTIDEIAPQIQFEIDHGPVAGGKA